MSENENETREFGTVPDEDLPEDLVPREDNPLAEGLPPGETPESLREADDQQTGTVRAKPDEVPQSQGSQP